MAGYNDSEGPYTGGAAGFFTHLAHITDITNKFDKDATPASGDGLTWNGSVYVPEAGVGSLGWEIAEDYALDTTGVTVHSAAAVQAWLDAGRVYAAGTISCSGPVVIKDDCDLSGLTFNYTGTTGIAIQIGTGTVLRRKTIRLPSVISTVKVVGSGWGAVAGTVGVKAVNTNACNIVVPHIQGFETGLHMAGAAQGNVYNNVYFGHLDNNKVNHLISSDATGWSNDNDYFGGLHSHESAEGSSVSGVRNIKLLTSANVPNNNVWLGTSFEGNVPEYHLEADGGENRWISCRWENATGCRVWWRTGVFRSMIDRGYSAHTIVETYEAGANAQTILSGQGWKVRQSASASGVLQLENASSATNPAITVMTAGAGAAGTDPTTGYAGYWAPNLVAFKRSTESFDRIQIDPQNSRIYFGSGAATIVRYLANLGTTSISVNGGNLVAGTDNALDLGIASFRFRDLNLGRNAVVGGNLDHDGSNVGFYGTAPAAKPTVTGSRGGNAALASLLTGLAGLGLITDSSTA